jgi:uncharacterized protein (DUF3820 family)
MSDVVTIPFGAYKGLPIDELSTKYLDWLIGQDWFCEKFVDIKLAIEVELNSRPDWLDGSFLR